MPIQILPQTTTLWKVKSTVECFTLIWESSREWTVNYGAIYNSRHIIILVLHKISQYSHNIICLRSLCIKNYHTKNFLPPDHSAMSMSAAQTKKLTLQLHIFFIAIAIFIAIHPLNGWSRTLTKCGSKVSIREFYVRGASAIWLPKRQQQGAYLCTLIFLLLSPTHNAQMCIPLSTFFCSKTSRIRRASRPDVAIA